jgi:cysteine sulfinate desulfinase/cysteine desulfurase-like protein
LGNEALYPDPLRARREGVRVSLGWSTTESDIERFVDAWRKLAVALSKGSKERRRGIAA